MATAASLSLKAYLKRYESGEGAASAADEQKKRRRKEKPPSKAAGQVVVVDEDTVSQKPAQSEEEPESSGDEKPIVDEDVEVKRSKRLEAIRARGSAADLCPKRKVRKVASRRSGLFSAKEIREEIDRKWKEEICSFAALDASKTGKGAEPVFRDEQGKRVTREELLKAKEKDKKLEWGKGFAQKRDAEARARELELEKEKPFARSSDDPDLNEMLKERIRWGDPMAHLVKRKDPELLLEDLGDNEGMKESGFIIPQTIPSHSWIKRGIDFPPNRYGIRAGRHWDGVDRSTGFEMEMFKRQNEKRATDREAYLWLVSEI